MNDYRKTIAAAIVSAGVLFSSVFGSNTASAYSSGVVTGNGVRLRSKPSLSSSILDKAYKGYKVTIKDKQGSWYKITLNGKEGWMWADYIKISGTSATVSNPSPTPSRGNVSSVPGWITANGGLNLRQAASTGSKCIKIMPKGSQVTIIGEKSGWYQVKWGNYSGWAYAKYITKNKPAPARQSSPSRGDEDRASSLASQVVDFAMQQLGKSYRYGAEGPNAFDCSGLTYYVYKHFGYSIPRDSKGQGFGNYAPTVSKSDLQPGDVIVFSSSHAGGYHIGMYIGNGKFIHSPNPGRTVSINSLSESWYRRHYIQAKRILR